MSGIEANSGSWSAVGIPNPHLWLQESYRLAVMIGNVSLLTIAELRHGVSQYYNSYEGIQSREQID